jgi:hypothetical protein
MATIRAASDRILATVAGFGKLKEGQWGPYQSVLFESPQLPEGKIWRSMEPEQAKTFQRGQQAYLVPTTNKQGAPSWDIELIDSPAPSNVLPMPPRQQQPAAQPRQGHSREEIEAYVGKCARLFRVCYDQAEQTLPATCGGEDVRAVASTLFIQAARKFNL